MAWLVSGLKTARNLLAGNRDSLWGLLHAPNAAQCECLQLPSSLHLPRNLSLTHSRGSWGDETQYCLANRGNQNPSRLQGSGHWGGRHLGWPGNKASAREATGCPPPHSLLCQLLQKRRYSEIQGMS